MTILEDLEKFANGLRTLINPSFNANVLKGFDPRVTVQQMDKIKQYINVDVPSPNYQPAPVPQGIAFKYHVPPPMLSVPSALPPVQETERTFLPFRVEAVRSQFAKDEPTTPEDAPASPLQPLRDWWVKVKDIGRYSAPSGATYDLRAVLGSFFLPVAIPALLGIAGAIGQALSPQGTPKKEESLF